MAYTKQTWANAPTTTSPVSGTRLTHIEDGIFAADSAAAAAAILAGTKYTKPGGGIPMSDLVTLTKADVGLPNVDNTPDVSKPISTIQQSALDLKANLLSPAFTGTPTGITKTHVGLSNVDNTADIAKPISTAQQTALDAKAPIRSIIMLTIATTLAAVVGREYVYLLGSGAVPTLPTAIGNTSIYNIKNTTGSAINLTTTSSQTIDGIASPLTVVSKASYTLVSDNTNWEII